MSSAESAADHASDEHARAISHLHRRQAEWDRQMEFHDQKQGELLTLQWKLMREQTGTLARELGIVQQQIQELRVDSRRVRTEVDQVSRDAEARVAEERGLRQSMFDGMDQRLRKVKQELEADLKAKFSPLVEMPRKISTIEEKLETRLTEHRTLEHDVAKLRKVVDGSLQDIEALKGALEQEAVERRNLEESSLEMVRDLRETVQKDIKDRAAFSEDYMGKHLARLETERTEREQALSIVSQRVANLQKEFAPYKEEMPTLRSRLQDAEGVLSSKLKDSQKNLDRDLAERAAAQQKLERRVNELQANSEKEMTARAQQAEEYEQALKTHRTKMKSLVGEQAELARLAREELQARLVEQLERETAMREAQRLDILDQWANSKATFEAKSEALETSLRTIEEQLREERAAETQALEAACQRQSEAVARQLKDRTEQLEVRLTQEREARETQGASLEEHMAFLDSFLQDVRQVFLQTSTRSRSFVSRKSSTTRELTAGSPPSQPRQPSRPPSPAATVGGQAARTLTNA